MNIIPSTNIFSSNHSSDPNQCLDTNHIQSAKLNHILQLPSQSNFHSAGSNQSQNLKMNKHDNQVLSESGASRSEPSVFQQQNISQQQQTPESAKKKDSSQPVINRVDSHEVIVNFKKHLLDKWKKNRAKQHLNKIIHYHIQHTFFLRYAAPLFLMDYSEQLQANLAKEGGSQTSTSREQGLITTLKLINSDVLSINGSKRTKSVEVLEAYLNKLQEKDQLSLFLDVIVYILFGETPPQIPAELNERKKNLFHYVSPIIAFLIIFYIHTEKKPVTLDELVTRSGFKQLYKNVDVPCKGQLSADSKMENIDSEDESDDDLIDEEDEGSLQQNSPFNTQPAQQSNQASDQKSRVGLPQFQDLEKTLQKQKEQQQQQQQQQMQSQEFLGNSMEPQIPPESNQYRINNTFVKKHDWSRQNLQTIHQSPYFEQIEQNQNNSYNKQFRENMQVQEGMHQRSTNLQGIPASNIHNHQHPNGNQVGIPNFKQTPENQVLNVNHQFRRA